MRVGCDFGGKGVLVVSVRSRQCRRRRQRKPREGIILSFYIWEYAIEQK